MNTEELARSYTSLGRAILRAPDAPWEDALSHGQLQSKAWLIDELLNAKRHLGMTYIVGGWLGLLPMLLFSEPELKVEKIRSFDIDPMCEHIADQVNVEHLIREWRFKAVTMDMFDIDYNENDYQIPVPGGYYDDANCFVPNKPARLREIPDTIINTSCDHIADFAKWWTMVPKGKLVALQNNNYNSGGPDHVNTVGNLGEMTRQAPMTRVLFSGERDFAKYSRFMMIGFK